MDDMNSYRATLWSGTTIDLWCNDSGDAMDAA